MDYDYWDNLSSVVYKRTYAREDTGTLENWPNTVERVIKGNVRNHDVPEKEINQLRDIMLKRKGTPAGRGLWFSGAPAHDELGGAALNNCWAVTADDWQNFVIAQDLLMLGGGVGMSVEHRFTSKLPQVKSGVEIFHKYTKDADFIVPDSREGWCELLRKILEAFFETGKGFSYSTVCVRGRDLPIKGFGGKASGPVPLVDFINKLCGILIARQGSHIRPIDAMDILCCTGEMVVSGNVRRSAIIIMGDCWDREYLTAKRWDLKTIPTERSCANLSVVCDDIEDLHPSFWKTYEHGEPYGLVNRKNIRRYGRMGEKLKDTAMLVNPCAEATLEDGEPCNLQETYLPRIESVQEFGQVVRLLHRYGKRVCAEKYHHPRTQEVVSRNARVGTGITGCLQSPLFNPTDLNYGYQEVQKENALSSREYNLPLSVRTTLVKPGGTNSLLGGIWFPGIHPAYARWMIRRIRFAASDKLIPRLKAAGHHMEPVVRFDGSLDHNTLVVDFYLHAPEGTPTAAEFDTWQQLDALLMAQKYWADQSVSVTVYYKKEEIPQIKEWLTKNLKNLKTISFLCHQDHGFAQAPYEEISEKEFKKQTAKLKPIDLSFLGEGELIDGLECEGGVCPTR